jgi:MoxR-like ATPase
MRKGAGKSFKEVEKVLSIEELHTLQNELEKIHIDKELEHYIIQLISATRDPGKFGLENIAENIMFGVSPRASIDLYKAAKAKAFLRGNTFVTPADIGYVIHDVFRHRIVLSYEARAKGVNTDEIISAIVEILPIP